MDDKTLITIAITCYREGNLLFECWQSILNQTTQNWKAVIVVDGGFDVLTEQIVNSLDHPRLQVYFNDRNLGPYLSRNKAFEVTDTLYHYYVDGDDYLAPSAIEEFYSAYQRYQSADIYYSDLFGFNKVGYYNLIESADQITSTTLTQGFALYGANIIKKEIWNKVKGYKERYNWTLGDLDFYMSCFEDGAQFFHINKPLYYYRRRIDSVSEQYTANYHQVYQMLIEDHPILFNSSELTNTFLSSGYYSSAHAEWVRYNFINAEALVTKAITLNPNKTAIILRSKIIRDKNWPFFLLKLKRRLAIKIGKYFVRR